MLISIALGNNQCVLLTNLPFERESYLKRSDWFLTDSEKQTRINPVILAKTAPVRYYKRAISHNTFLSLALSTQLRPPKKKKKKKKNIPPREKETIAAPKSISSCHSRSLKTTTIDERSSPRGGGGGELLKRLEGKKKRNQKERWRKRGRKMERKR